MEVRFVVSGVPVGKQRPRSLFKQHRLYTPQKTVDYEQFVKYCYYGNYNFEDKPLGIEIKMFVPISASTSKKKKEEMLSNILLPTKKPDIDNCIKSILDGLNGIAYNDDKQICSLTATKAYCTNPRVEVRLWNL